MQYIGAMTGDFCGSIYEWNNTTTEAPEDIEILKSGKFTDDSVLTGAIMDWLIHTGGDKSETLVDYLKRWTHAFPGRGYGGRYFKWAQSDSREPIDSFGNGSAMRVSPCAFYANTLEECLELAEKSAMVTHNHPEGVKGAKAIAEAIYLARSGASKNAIKKTIMEDFGYDLNKELNEIGHAAHRFDATCQVTVPEAIICFLKSNDFISAIRNAIWIGGDTDTLAAMAGPIAEAYYGIPSVVEEKMKDNFKKEDALYNVVCKFNELMLKR